MDTNPVNMNQNRPVVTNQLEHKKDGKAIMSLVLGILGILFCWCVGVDTILCLIGLIIGIVSLAKTGQGSRMAIAGVITSAIGVVLSVAVLLLVLLAV